MSRASGGAGRRLLREERGAVLIQVGVAAIVLCGFCGLVVDYGVFWVARAQAQNAADAGALAGATSLAFDSIQDPGVAEAAALATATSNYVWNEPALTETSASGYPADAPGPCLIPGAPIPPGGGLNVASCIRVEVFRNIDRGNPLPTFFAKLFGVDSQGVHALSVGAAGGANTTTCLAPLAIPDRWTGPGTGPLKWSTNPPSRFVKYAAYPTLAAPGNTYDPPAAASGTVGAYGTGYQLNDNSMAVADAPFGGLALELTRFDPSDFANYALNFGIATNEFVSVNTGGSFESALGSCNGVKWQIGDLLELDNTGTTTQATAAALTRLGADAGAHWDTVQLRVANACCGLSPRLMVIPLFDVDYFETTRQTGLPKIRIANFAGFFIDTVVPSTSIRGYLTTYPGSIDTSTPQVPYLSAFLRTGVLFR